VDKFIFRIKTLAEHQLKNLGLYTGVMMALGAIVIWCLDVFVVEEKNFISNDNLEKINAINITISSLLIAILLTTFSVVFVVMQLASSQFSPRILRYFIYSDVKIQQFIGALLGTTAFIYLPIILNLITDTKSEKSEICSLISVLLNFICLLISFPRVINHLSDNMNAAAITNRVKNEVIQEIDVIYSQNWQQGDRLLYKRPGTNHASNKVVIFWNGDSGYLSEVNYNKLSSLYQSFVDDNIDLPKPIIYQKPIVGEFIMSETTPILVIEFESQIKPETEERIKKDFLAIVDTVFTVNKYRSYTQDINFGVRKLVDIAIKAISPAVNDPTTCLNCIDHLGEIVRKLAMKKFPSTQSTELKHEKIYINEFGFEELVDFCFDQIYQWGKNDPVIIKRIIKTIQQILPCVQNPYNLMVLIREVEDMELHRIYADTIESRGHTLEQIKSINNDLKKFVSKSIEQIQLLEDKGIFSQYSDATDLDIVSLQEANCINYLKKYKND
jgi:uncharacterized membrane protein